MDFQVLEPFGIVLHLVADIEFLLRLQLRQDVLFFRHHAEPLLVPGRHIPGDVAFHGRLITIREIDGLVLPPEFVLPVNPACVRGKVRLIDAQIVHVEGIEDIMAALLKLPDQVAPPQGGDDEIGRGLKHVRGVLQGLHRGIVHAIEAYNPVFIIQRDHYKRTDVLCFQIFVLQRVAMPDFLQAVDDDISAHAELPVPAGADLRGDILKVFLLRPHPFRRPLIGIVVAPRGIALEDVSPLSLQGLSQIFQEHLQSPVRRLFQKGRP